MADTWLTVREAAARLRVSTATVYKLIDRGEREHTRVVNSIRIGEPVLATYLARGNAYQDRQGRSPYRAWLDDIRDMRERPPLPRASLVPVPGCWGNTRDVGDGVHEMKIDVGPGYRVYFANDGGIKAAKANWVDYKARKP